jgi:hypothetical protein
MTFLSSNISQPSSNLLGETFINHKIVSEVREVDLWFIPTANTDGDRRALGLLGQMLKRRSVFESFRKAVKIDEIDICLSNLNLLKEETRREAKREKRRWLLSDRPQLWILSPTVSSNTLAAFAAKPRRGWEKLVYFLPPARPASLVAIHQLPETPRTLFLRLMGQEQVQVRAIEELLALPDSHPFKLQTVENLAALQIQLQIGSKFRN